MVNYQVKFCGYGVEIGEYRYDPMRYDGRVSMCMNDICNDFPDMNCNQFVVITEHMREIVERAKN